ncbi:MAG: NAD(P)/FAD-dependent oxidoreductase, partial [Rhodospirillales bacterium]
VAPMFARAARRAGADIREHTEATGVARDAGGFILETRTGPACRARVLVNAAGAWGGGIAAWLGENFPVAPRGPTMSATEPLPYFIVPNMGVMDGLYLRQIPRGNVLFGSGQGPVDLAGRRARPQAELTLRAARLLLDAVPGLKSAQVIRNWTGIEGYMPDDKPVLGPSAKTPGLIHCFGFSGHGFQLGPGAGAVVAELALDGKTPTDISGLSPGRFKPSSPS